MIFFTVSGNPLLNISKNRKRSIIPGRLKTNISQSCLNIVEPSNVEFLMPYTKVEIAVNVMTAKNKNLSFSRTASNRGKITESIKNEMCKILFLTISGVNICQQNTPTMKTVRQK
ncbi:MAG: hypothetical protein IKA22_00990 [Lentisphaeria bacterium]|nr:hypothetical protein [Lentisphaeria bacterium]